MTEHTRPPTTKLMRVTWAVFSAAILIAASVVIYLAIWGSGESESKESAQAGEAAQQSQKKDLATQVAEACRAGGEVAKNLTQRGLCGKAQEIIKEGPVGPPGPEGRVGATGPPGPAGRDGRDGQSPPCLLQANRCVGPQGPIGATGPIGPQGIQGAEGPAGKDGVDGADGQDGTNGTDGIDGTNGKSYGCDGTVVTDPSNPPKCPGAPGTNGTDGDDAYPFTFTFTVPGSIPNTTTTYTCTINGSTGNPECIRSEQP